MLIIILCGSIRERGFGLGSIILINLLHMAHHLYCNITMDNNFQLMRWLYTILAIDKERKPVICISSRFLGG